MQKLGTPCLACLALFPAIRIGLPWDAPKGRCLAVVQAFAVPIRNWPILHSSAAAVLHTDWTPDGLGVKRNRSSPSSSGHPISTIDQDRALPPGPPTAFPTMTNDSRIKALEAAYEVIAALITQEEADTYPCLDHLADLIADARREGEE